MLNAALVTISAINDVTIENKYHDHIVGFIYGKEDKWLELVAIMAIVSHGIAIFIRILYFSRIKRCYSGFSIMVSDVTCYRKVLLFLNPRQLVS